MYEKWFQSSGLFVFFIVPQRLTLVSNAKRKMSKSIKSELWNCFSYRGQPYLFEVPINNDKWKVYNAYTLFFFVCYASKSEIRVWAILKNFYPKSIEINLLHCHLKIVASNLSVLENCFRIAACVFSIETFYRKEPFHCPLRQKLP